MTFGLKKQNIEKINLVLSKYPDVERVMIYGSRAKGNYKNSSDIDLTLIGNKIDLDTLFKIDNDLDNLLSPYNLTSQSFIL